MAGGGGHAIAVIRVLYKPGTTSTCSSGQTIMHSNESGDYLFFIPFAGNWTVSGTDSYGTVKISTVTVAVNDMKTVLFDSLIPPSDREYYREVEYLQIKEHAKACVALGMTNRTTEDWYIKINKYIPEYITNPSATGGIIGNDNWNSAGFQATGRPVGTGYRLAVQTGDSATTSAVVLSSGVPYSIKLVIKSNPEIYVDDGETPVVNVGWEIGRKANQFCVGCNGAYAGMPVNNASPGKYYSVEIAQANTIVSNYVPCVRIKIPETGVSDNMPGYYDVINNYFYQGVYMAEDTYTPSFITSDVIKQITPGPYIYL